MVLVSHWRPVGGDQESGTPIEWLVDSYRTVIEIHSECPPAEALERFFARTRHPGHLDNERDKNDVAGTLLKWANSYPLGIGKVISVSSEPGLNLEHLISQISAAASCRQK